MSNELKTVSGSKAENERKKKQLEMQANELSRYESYSKNMRQMEMKCK
mgnify:CR=1 FL=1